MIREVCPDDIASVEAEKMRPIQTITGTQNLKNQEMPRTAYQSKRRQRKATEIDGVWREGWRQTH